MDERELSELLGLARDKSVASRTKLVEIVGDLFFGGDTNALSERERSLMTEILRQLIHDVEMQVRKALARRLSAEPEAPRDLINTLANDQIEVAHDILIASDVLQDAELIEVIRHRTQEHQLAITNRRKLSETVSDALVQTNDMDVIKSLLENKNAAISRATMEYLVEQSKRVDALQNPLVFRPDLAPELAQRMYWWVSAALRKHIVGHYNIDPTELDETIEDVARESAANNASQQAIGSKTKELARELARSNKITVKLLVQALRQGEVSLFQAMFAEHVGLRDVLVHRLIFEPGGEGLAIACKSVDIAKPDFATIFLLSRAGRPGDKVVDPNELQRALKFFDAIKPETTQKVVKRWQRDPDFLLALKRIDDTEVKAARIKAAS